MKSGKQPRAEPQTARQARPASAAAEQNQQIIKRFTWEIASISVYLQELRQFWAEAIGISGPQWMILMALADLDEDGAPVNVVSKMLHVDPSFVTTQSKLLEKKGFLHRKSSSTDARVVQMSLTEKTRNHLKKLASQQQAINDFIFEEFDHRELAEFTNKLGALKNRLEKARLKVAIDF